MIYDSKWLSIIVWSNGQTINTSYWLANKWWLWLLRTKIWVTAGWKRLIVVNNVWWWCIALAANVFVGMFNYRDFGAHGIYPCPNAPNKKKKSCGWRILQKGEWNHNRAYWSCLHLMWIALKYPNLNIQVWPISNQEPSNKNAIWKQPFDLVDASSLCACLGYVPDNFCYAIDLVTLCFSLHWAFKPIGKFAWWPPDDKQPSWEILLASTVTPL